MRLFRNISTLLFAPGHAPRDETTPRRGELPELSENEQCPAGLYFGDRTTRGGRSAFAGVRTTDPASQAPAPAAPAPAPARTHPRPPGQLPPALPGSVRRASSGCSSAPA